MTVKQIALAVTSAIIGCLVAFLIQAYLSNPTATDASVTPTKPTAPEKFEAAHHENRVLSDRIAKLEQQVQSLQLLLQNQVHHSTQIELGVSSTSPNNPQVLPETETPLAQDQTAALIQTGITAEIAQEIVDTVDELSLTQLQRRFDAIKGNKNNDGRSNAPQLSIREVLEDRFGATAYDKYLYAQGRPNRLSVSSVMANSAADQIGLRNGDLLVSVNGTRIHNQRDLFRNLVADDPSTLTLTIQRGEQRLSRQINPGPLGVRLLPISVNPDV